jgi:N-acetylglucosamine malate deacetylase 2
MIDNPELTAKERERAGGVLTKLMLARPIDEPAVVVTAHPDDETLAMGGRLKTFKRLTLIQLTDGAPPTCEGDAKRAGFAHRMGYAAERESEALQALAALDLNCRRVLAGLPDQDSIFFVPNLLRILERELQGAALVFTHPYEGGHPDHDTAAFASQLACDLIRAKGGTPPARLEFASYHHSSGALVTGRFWPDQTCPEIAVPLENEAEKTKRRALAEYRTQASVIAWFQPREEHYRAAPRYDFARPPPPGFAQYDLFGWSMTAARWRSVAARYSIEARA